MTPSTGRRCGLAGWDYRGREAFITISSWRVCPFMKKFILTVSSLSQSHALVPGHRPAEDQQRELGLQYRRGLRGEPRPAAFLHQNHCAWYTCSLWRAPQVSSPQFDSSMICSRVLSSLWPACGSLQVRWWDCGGERSHDGGNEQLVSHPHAQAAEEQSHTDRGVVARESSVEHTWAHSISKPFSLSLSLYLSLSLTHTLCPVQLHSWLGHSLTLPYVTHCLVTFLFGLSISHVTRVYIRAVPCAGTCLCQCLVNSQGSLIRVQRWWQSVKY